MDDEVVNERLVEQQATSTRIILISYWIIVLIGLPIWWYTTHIERLPLPDSRVELEATKKVVFPISLCLQGSSQAHPVLTELNSTLARAESPEHLRLKTSIGCPQSLPSGNGSTLYSLSVAPPSAQQEIIVHGRELIVKMSPNGVDAIINVLESLINPPSPSAKAQYSPRYRLAFSLLNEDSSFGGVAIAWHIEAALTRYLHSSLRDLSIIHNFTIESQVQYHAPLAFEPHIVTTTADDNSSSVSYHLDQDHIKTFVNSAEWTLASTVNNDVVLHFILFIPSSEHRPMRVIKADGTPSRTNAFIIPQWGGIIILNPPITFDNSGNHVLSVEELSGPFALFRSQLYALLGVPKLPHPVKRSEDEVSVLSPWQIDALIRTRALENIKGSQEALDSIVKLVHQIRGMPVKADVQKDVMDSLDYLEKTRSSQSALLILQNSIQALILSSRAFFNPGMLAMLYFPPEHKYAVYTPLFAPISAPLIVATLKELASILKARRKRKEMQERLTRNQEERTSEVGKKTE